MRKTSLVARATAVVAGCLGAGILAGVAGGVSSAIAQDKELRFITGNDYKPFTDEGLPGGGLITEIVRQVMEDRGFEVDVEFTDKWSDVYDRTAKAEFDATFPYYYRIRRARDFAYSDPIYVESQWAMTRSGIFEPASVAELDGKVLCYPQGYALPALVVPAVKEGRIKHEEPNTMARCFELLALNRVDFVIAGRRQGLQLAAAVPDFSADRVTVSKFPLQESKLHLIIPHEVEEKRNLIRDFNRGLRLLKADGRYTELVRQYLPGWDEEPPVSKATREGRQARYEVELPSGRKFKADVRETETGQFELKTRYGEVTLGWREVAKFNEISETADASGATTTASTSTATTTVLSTPTASVAAGTGLQLSGVSAVGSSLIPALAKAFAGAGGTPGDWQDAEDGAKVLSVDGRGDNLSSMAYRTANATAAVGQLVEGQTDIALSDRQILPAETQRALQANLGDLRSETAEKVIALKAGAVLVNPANAVGTLTFEQIQAIFRGQIRDWAAVGGAPGPIQVVAPNVQTAAGRLMTNTLLQGGAVTSTAVVAVNEEDVFARVSGAAGAIGFASLAQGDTRAKALNINRCNVLYAPTSFQVKAEEYPFVQRIYMYAPPLTGNRYVGSFVSFAESDAGQQIVASRGFVDLRMGVNTSADYELKRQRLAAYRGDNAAGVNGYLRATQGRSRLSQAFRFNSGTAQLDARSLRDVRRTAAYLRQQGQNRRVTLIGFADARGGARQNFQLSVARAQEVAN